MSEICINPEVIGVIACPHCWGSLQWGDALKFLSCTLCHKTYPIEDGIPQMYVEETPYISGTDSVRDSFHVSQAKLETLAREENRIVPATFPMTRFRNQPLFLGIRLVFCLLILVLGIWVPWEFILLLLFLFLGGDYLYYRYKSSLIGRAEAASLLAMLQDSQFQEYDIQKDHQAVRLCSEIPPLKSDSRSLVLQGILNKYFSKNFKQGLHLGCGGVDNGAISLPYLEKGLQFWGIDISRQFLSEYHQMTKQNVFLANACRVPFPDETLDFVNATDILEHFHDPLGALKEIFRILCPGGLVVVAVPNRTRLNYAMINPFVLLEALGGSFQSSMLPPVERLLRHENSFFFHTAYTAPEMKVMSQSVGFQIKHLSYQMYAPNEHSWLNKLLEKIPLMNRLNEYVIAVLEKPGT